MRVTEIKKHITFAALTNLFIFGVSDQSNTNTAIDSTFSTTEVKWIKHHKTNRINIDVEFSESRIWEEEKSTIAIVSIYEYYYKEP